MSVAWLVRQSMRLHKARCERALELAIDRYNGEDSNVKVIDTFTPDGHTPTSIPYVVNDDRGAWVLARVFVPNSELPEQPK